MAFCANCGQQNRTGLSFCTHCGMQIVNRGGEITNQRKILYEGEIRKCPNCGEVLNSFQTNCPACGYELRGAKTSYAVREFTSKLEFIESSRKSERTMGMLAGMLTGKKITNTDEQIINLIKNFVVPNTREDILEFLILAASNINTTVFSSMDDDNSAKREKAINDAWVTKMNQVYSKARLSHGGSEYFYQIEEIYANCAVEINAQKKKRIVKHVLSYGWIPLFFIILAIFVPHSIKNSESKLEALIADIEILAANGEYELALMKTEFITWSSSDQSRVNYWEMRKAHCIKKIVDEALANGVYLDYKNINSLENNEQSNIKLSEK